MRSAAAALALLRGGQETSVQQSEPTPPNMLLQSQQNTPLQHLSMQPMAGLIPRQSCAAQQAHLIQPVQPALSSQPQAATSKQGQCAGEALPLQPLEANQGRHRQIGGCEIGDAKRCKKNGTTSFGWNSDFEDDNDKSRSPVTSHCSTPASSSVPSAAATASASHNRVQSNGPATDDRDPTAWVEDFQTYLEQKKFSKSNINLTLKCIIPLANGEGILHPLDKNEASIQVPRVFLSGHQLHWKDDIASLQVQAKAFLPTKDDKSKGWTLNHPLSKLLKFQEFKWCGSSLETDCERDLHASPNCTTATQWLTRPACTSLIQQQELSEDEQRLSMRFKRKCGSESTSTYVSNAGSSAASAQMISISMLEEDLSDDEYSL